MSQRSLTRVETAIGLLTQDKPLIPGAFITIERFEEVFEFQRDSQEFNWLIYEIRKILHREGLHLSGEGRSITGGYSIIDPRENHYIAKLAMARAERDLADKEVLLVNTDTSTFGALEKVRHENTLRMLSLRLSALRQVQSHNKKLAQKRKVIIEEQEEQEEQEEEE